MVKSRALLALAAVLLATGANAAPTPMGATLRVTIDGVNKAGGVLHVGLYDEATFPEAMDFPLFKRDISGIAGDVGVTFDKLPPGSYAVKAYQDLNNDGRWEMGEPRGVSNDAAAGDFDAAALVLQPGANMAALHLK